MEQRPPPLPAFLLPTLVFKDGVIRQLTRNADGFTFSVKNDPFFLKLSYAVCFGLIAGREEVVRTASGLLFLGLPYELWMWVPLLMTSWLHMALPAICLAI